MGLRGRIRIGLILMISLYVFRRISAILVLCVVLVIMRLTKVLIKLKEAVIKLIKYASKAQLQTQIKT